jgi:transketolase
MTTVLEPSVETAETAAADVPGTPEWIAAQGLGAVETSRLAQLHAARRDPRIFSLEGDLGDWGGPAFQAEFPDRFRDMGIAEANLIGTAAGLALGGKVSFVNTFGSFALMRACEQVRLDVAYHRTNVKIAGSFTGIGAAFSGPTHHCGEDLAIARVLPGMTVLAPADSVASYHLTAIAARTEGPFYLRLGLEPTPQVYDETATFTVGGANVLRDGTDLTLIAAGLNSVASALKAADLLAGQGLRVRVVDLYSIKPVNREVIVESARRTGLIVTVEEHSVHGGVGSTVAEVVAEEAPVPVRKLGLADEFSHEMCSYDDHLRRNGLDPEGIARAAVDSFRRWK